MKTYMKKRRDSLIVLQNNRCAYCGKWMPIGTATIDHIIPKSKNGTNSLDNLVVCCYDCNLEKNNDYIVDRLDLIKTNICWDKIKKSIEDTEQKRSNTIKKEVERICQLDRKTKKAAYKKAKKLYDKRFVER